MKNQPHSLVTSLLLAAGLSLFSRASLVAAPAYALSFDGVDDYVETSTAVIPSSGDFTVECWVACPTAPGTYREILSQGSSGNAFYIGTDLGNNLRLGDGWGTVSPAVPFPVGGWHHLAVVKSSTNTLFYLDGTNRLARGSAMPNPAATTGLRLGRQYNGHGEYWPGSLGDVRIWSKALSAAEVSTSRSSSVTGAEAGLVAAWQFLEGTGTNCAAIGATNVVGTLLNGPFWMTPGSDYALTLDGVNDYVETSTGVIPASGDFTVAFWAKAPTAPNSYREILSQGTGANSFFIGTDPANNLRVSSGWGQITNPVAFPVGGWHHFTLVKSATNTIFYLNGTNPLSRGSAIPNPTASTGLRLGRQVGNYAEYWPGSLDDVSIWNKALSEAEVRAVLNKSVAGTESNLVAYWSFNDLTAVARGNTNVMGLLVNGPTWTTSAPDSPAVTTGEATHVSYLGATFNGTVNPGNLPTTVWFEIGLTTNYGLFSPVTVLSPTNGSVAVSLSVYDLALVADRTYHFRLVASNNVSQTQGVDRTLHTLAFAYVVPFAGVESGSVAWGDVDHDDRLDCLINGNAERGGNTSALISRVYRNNGDDTFADINAGLPGTRIGSAAWGDYDNDGWLDLLLTGYTGTDLNFITLSRVYRNTGQGAFALNTNAVLPAARMSSVAWGDYDNDGRLDLVMAGQAWLEERGEWGLMTRVYRNTGEGSFSWNTNAALPGVWCGSVAWGDYDNDGRQDLLITGSTSNRVTDPFGYPVEPISRVYRNNGDGTFSDINVGLPGVQDGSVAWGDYDSDGRLDVLLTGATQPFGWERISVVYRNNGNGTFTNINAGLPGVASSSVAWGDGDNDGRLDILLTGMSESDRISRIYRNHGDGTFTDLNAELAGVDQSSVAWADYNRDGRLDLLLTGSITNRIGSGFSGVFQNFIPLTNTPPSAPTGLTATVSGSGVTLSWAVASDAETPAAGLTYNLRVGSTPGGSDLLQPNSNLTNGLRRLAQMGNAQHNTSVTLDFSRRAGRVCYWSVQAVDNSWAASPFATEGSFTSPDTYHAPIILNEPLDLIAFSGTAAELNAHVTGVPRDCRWYRDGGVVVPGGTNASLVWNNVSAADAGSYWLVVSNGLGMVTSRVASVTVWDSPSSQIVPSGRPVSLAVMPPGSGSFAFRWQRDGTNLPAQIIRTVAGNGTASFGGDGGRAVNAGFSNVLGLALDAVSQLYLSDTADHRVRKVSLDGGIQTLAGTGTPGLSAEGQLATLSGLNQPKGAVVDAARNLFIADAGNHRVCKVGPDGLLTTVAGGGTQTADGVRATEAFLPEPQFLSLDGAGNLFITVLGDQRVRKVTPDGRIWTAAGNGDFVSSGDATWATNTAIIKPYGIAMNAGGDFFVVDREVIEDKSLPVFADLLYGVTSNGSIRIVAGQGTNYTSEGLAATNARLVTLGGLALDPEGNLYFSESYLARIRRIGTNGIVQTVVGNGTTGFSGDGGAALQASLSGPTDLACDRVGNLYFSDAGNARLRQVVNTDRTLLSLAGASAADAGNYRLMVTDLASGLSFTSAVASVTLADPPQIVTQPVDSTNCAGMTVIFTVSAEGTGPLSYRWYRQGSGLVAGGNGPVLTLANLMDSQAGAYFAVVTNTFGAVTSNPARLTMVAPPRFLTQPQNLDLAAGASGLLTASVTGGGPFAYQWQRDGTNLPHGIIATLTNVPAQMPIGMTMDAAGNLFVADGMGHRVYKCSPGGLVTVVAGTGIAGFAGDNGPAINARLTSPYWVALDATGNLFISDTGTNRVRKVATNGIITTMAGMGIGAFFGDGNPATNALLNMPAGLAFDASGALFIGDAYNNRIRKIAPDGIITTVAGNGDAVYAGDGGPATLASLASPILALPNASGSLFVADMGNHCVRRINASGVITTVAGNAVGAFAGDGGAATNASLKNPAGLALDATGNLYIADMQNHRVRRVDADGVIATVAGNGNSGNTGDGGPALNAAIGAPVSLLPDRAGGLFIASQQGIRRVTSLAGPALTLDSGASNTWGSYRLVVTSLTSGASITSAVAVVSQPRLRILIDERFGFLTNRFGFNMTSPINQAVVVEATTNLGTQVWTPLKTNSVGTNAVYFSDPGWQQFPTRIYRLRTSGSQ